MATFPAINPWYSWFKIPQFNTHIISYGNQVEQRISLDSSATYKHQIKFKILSVANKNTILDFFIARKGAFESFDWVDPDGTNQVVRFEEDIMNLEYFQYQLWRLNKVTFKGVTE